MQQEQSNKERISKVLSRAGFCSRRDAEKLIESGVVKYNGEVVSSPAFKLLMSDADKITVGFKKVNALEKTRIWLFHKPRECITSRKDERDRKTIYDYLPRKMANLICVGRLDFNTEGLLLLTNDGEYARKLEHPSNGFKRCYKVRAYGRAENTRLKKIEAGCVIDGVKYQKAEVKQISKSEGSSNSWYEVTLVEGKNREVRKLFEYMGLSVNKLIRISYGPYLLGDVKIGKISEVDVICAD